MAEAFETAAGTLAERRVSALTAAEAALACAQLPGDGEVALSHIGALVASRRLDDAAGELRDLIASAPCWAGVVRDPVRR